MLPIRHLALAALLVLTACGADPAGPTAADDVLGRTFQLVEGGTTTLAALHAEDGRPLLVNLWATWCKPCIEEMDLLGRWGKSLAAEGKGRGGGGGGCFVPQT